MPKKQNKALRADLDQLMGQAQQLLIQGDLPQAQQTFRAILSLQPDNAEAHGRLGLILIKTRSYDEAEKHLQRAIELAPDHVAALCGLGIILQNRGRPKTAAKLFRQAIAIRPDYAEAHYNLVGPKNFTPEAADIAALEKLAANMAALPDNRKIYIHYALAKVLEGKKDYAGAYENLRRGASLKRRDIQYNEAENIRIFERTKAAFTPELFKRLPQAGADSAAPIFILGMPRSGSTLVEQILASHPLVQGGGELETMRLAANAGVLDTSRKPIPYPEYVPALTAQVCGVLGQLYIDNLPKLEKGKKRITDKLPLNFMWAGLIRLILPNAKIIHTMRDPVDTCLSCYSTLFTSGQKFSYELGELGRYYNRYHDLMAHWRKVMPKGSMLDLSYDALVDDFEPNARRLLDYCGLPWDERVLNFHETKRTVTTASAAQVRQPLFKQGRKRGKHYEAYLGPLLKELKA